MARRKRGGKTSDKAKALDEGLKAMFRALEQRPVPKGVADVVEQLDAASKPPKREP